jgi:RNA polymerase sigma-70 factor (sigma-E family)
VRAADEAEFREYMAARWPTLLRTAYLLTGDRHLAEDLTQTALEKTAVAWSRVQRADDMDAYVRRILLNTHLSLFRRKRVAEYVSRETPEVPATDSTQQIALRDELLKALATLPKRQCAVIVLRYWEDLSESQTAAILGCSVGTVRSQAHKALAKLRVSPLLDDSNPLGTDTAKEGRV